jgi:hypothetical protein
MPDFALTAIESTPDENDLPKEKLERCASSGRQHGSLLTRWSSCEQKEKTDDVKWRPSFDESCRPVLEENDEYQRKSRNVTVGDCVGPRE